MQSRKVLAATLLFLFALTTVSPIVSTVKATVKGAITVTRPDNTVPGGSIEVDAAGIEVVAGGTVYFYLSKNDEPEISSGDIYFASMKTRYVIGETFTLRVPENMAAGGYYLKASDLKKVGVSAVVSGNTVKVLEKEKRPVITIDLASGAVGYTPTVSGFGLDDYETVDIIWISYDGDVLADDVDVADFEEGVEIEIPDAFKGTYPIIIFATNEETLATYATFTIVPDLPVVTLPADFSVASGLDASQEVDLEGTGFPRGTIKADSIKLIVKNFKTGNVTKIIETSHDEVGVEDGGFTLTMEADRNIPDGVVDIEFVVDGEVVYLRDIFLSSKPRIPGKFDAKMDKTSGYVGDSITFAAIGLPAGVDVTIVMTGLGTQIEVDGGTSDDNGAWEFTYAIEDMVGGDYSVKVWDDTNARYKTVGIFKLLSKMTIKSETKAGQEFPELPVFVDGKKYLTPVQILLEAGMHRLKTTPSFKISGLKYSFDHWRDETGEVLSNKVSFALDVQESITVYAVFKPIDTRLSITITAPSSIPINTEFELEATITNTGNTFIEDTTVRISMLGSIGVKSGESIEIDIGTLDPGDSETVTWHLTPTKRGTFTITLTAEGTDENGKTITKMARVKIKVR